MHTSAGRSQAATPISAYGVTVSVESDSDLHDDCLKALPPWFLPGSKAGLTTPKFALTQEPDGGHFTVHCPAGSTATPDRDSAVRRLSGEIELYVAEHAVERVFVHAAAVRLHDQIVCFPGRTMTGKSTLSVALCRAGAEYLSDEYLVVDAAGLAYAYPRTPQLRAGTPYTPASAFGPDEPVGPVDLVVAVSYDSSRRWDVRAVSGAEVVLTLLSNAIAARSRPEECMDAFAQIATVCRGFTGTRGDAQMAAAELSALVRSGDPARFAPRQ